MIPLSFFWRCDAIQQWFYNTQILYGRKTVGCKKVPKPVKPNQQMGVMPNDDARKNSGLTSEQVPLIHVHQSVWWLVVVWAKKIAVAKWEKTAFETVWIFNQIPSYIVILLILVEKCLMIFHTVHFFTLGHHIHLYLLYFKKKTFVKQKDVPMFTYFASNKINNKHIHIHNFFACILQEE